MQLFGAHYSTLTPSIQLCPKRSKSSAKKYHCMFGFACLLSFFSTFIFIFIFMAYSSQTNLNMSWFCIRTLLQYSHQHHICMWLWRTLSGSADHWNASFHKINFKIVAEIFKRHEKLQKTTENWKHNRNEIFKSQCRSAMKWKPNHMPQWWRRK